MAALPPPPDPEPTHHEPEAVPTGAGPHRGEHGPPAPRGSGIPLAWLSLTLAIIAIVGALDRWLLAMLLAIAAIGTAAAALSELPRGHEARALAALGAVIGVAALGVYIVLTLQTPPEGWGN